MKAATLLLCLMSFLPTGVVAQRAAQPSSSDDRLRLAAAALAQVGITRIYDPSYVRIPYPGGDVPLERGVCADVVVRAFRAIGVDLQVAVHQDMIRAFHAYPQSWGLRRPDPNIDHRRVPNLMRFFDRKGKSLPLDRDFRPGDVVAWRLPNGLLHIGMVSSRKVPHAERYQMVHNIGEGARLEDVLEEFTIIGHYRW
ncbi:MAG: DUF1287 domain-containing protein [Thermoanaerobaculia bacterium]